MTYDLTDTTASAISSALLQARRQAGSPAMGMVLTFVVITDEAGHHAALKTATTVSTEHPSRVLGVIRGAAKGPPRLDAEIKIGNGTPGESVLLRLSGELTKHAESVVLPLLLADSPVVAWWPAKAPDDPADDPLGALAQRRITDSANAPRNKAMALLTQARNYTPGNTDLAWTRVTPWRALLAAALDQQPAKVKAAAVQGEKISPSTDLLAAWLRSKLKVPVEQSSSRGPGITQVRLTNANGDIMITRPDGRLAMLCVPGRPDRPVALKRREIDELLAEELRRLDPDDVYADAVAALVKAASARNAKSAAARSK
ncbi:MAG TPA: glucose-6-phosphate dehydrogenase assembly protein OpcA [Nocardioidaceae bacterium]|nr:glucose-6-phosphate dehydrogenase assembly protein OpcA [Nocardioidaceae bacterium]